MTMSSDVTTISGFETQDAHATNFRLFVLQFFIVVYIYTNYLVNEITLLYMYLGLNGFEHFAPLGGSHFIFGALA